MSLVPGLIRPDHPEPRPLEELVRRFAPRVRGDVRGRYVTGLTIRSQDVRPGDVFAALPGARLHGASLADAAQRAGAVALLTDARGAELAAGARLPVLVVEDPRALLGSVAAWILRTDGALPLLLGVTGTNGKTTTVTMIDHLLQRLGRTTGVSSTAERSIAGERVPARLTTPEADELHGLLAAMRERGVTAAALEVSAQALVRARVSGVRFDVAGFTNLSHDHLDDFGDMDTYFAAKAALFEPDRTRVGVVSLDSPYGARLARRAGVPVATIASGAAADWRIGAVRPDGEWTRFRIEGPGGERLATRVRMLGGHAAANAALAVAMLVTAGIDLPSIEAALGDRGLDVAVPGRLERLPGSAAPAVYLDIAHTPDAFLASLTSLRAVTPGRILMVFGADGDRDASKRPQMGRIAATHADVVLVTDHHARFEDPAAIRAALLEGAREGHAEVHDVPDPSEAIRWAVREAGPGDAVYWAGTGRTEYREIRGAKIPYSFPEEARRALDEARRAAA